LQRTTLTTLNFNHYLPHSCHADAGSISSSQSSNPFALKWNTDKTDTKPIKRINN